MGNKKSEAKSRRSKARFVASKPATNAPWVWHTRAEALGSSPIVFALASLFLLIPCYWSSRLQAGDLSSHIYNSWLAQLIESGKTQGLIIAHQTTNVLFDLLLSSLFKAFGATVAQRVAVTIAVLIFAWGAFAFTSVVAGRRAWNMLPAISILSYGWVFHMGFFNFYLSLGLCFFALAIAWERNRKWLTAAALLLAVAYVAHGLPVAWTVALIAYSRLARRLDLRFRAYLLGGALGILFLLRMVLDRLLITRWQASQILLITGADQAYVFDGKYLIISLGLLLVWILFFAGTVQETRLRTLVSSLPFHFCLLTAAGIFLLPTGVLIPSYNHVLTFIAERMTLALGVCLCALFAAARPTAFARYALLALMFLFFGFLYHDHGVLNRLEDRMEAAIAQMPVGQRVVSGISATNLRVDALNHMIDRVCVARCYSYANYEPSTAQFRIRAVAQNPFVVFNYGDSWRLQTGSYIVKPQDIPLYKVNVDAAGRMIVVSLMPGKVNGVSSWNFY